MVKVSISLFLRNREEYMSDSMPLISIIMPTYNAARYLARAIESVQAQEYTHWELLIVDDGSLDATSDVLISYLNDPRIRLYRHPTNQGVAAARNTGIDASQGEYIACIDADDEWHPRKLSLQINAMEQTGAQLSCGDIIRINANGKGRVLQSYRSKQYDYNTLLRYNFVVHSTLVYQKDIVQMVRYSEVAMTPFHQKLFAVFGVHHLIHEDYAFLLKLFRNNTIEVAYITEPLARYRVYNSSYSNGFLKKFLSLFCIYRNSEGYSTMRSLYYLFRRMVFFVSLKS